MAVALEDFAQRSTEVAATTAGLVPMAEAETARMDAYEQGYKAGWDDAARAEGEDQARIGAEFANHLQEMSFTFHEARTHLLRSMEPLLRELFETFLPAAVRDTMGPRVLETLEPLILECAESPIRIAVGPGCKAALEPYLSTANVGIIDIIEEPTLSEGQAFLRIAETERKIDLSEALTQISSALDALTELNERALNYG